MYAYVIILWSLREVFLASKGFKEIENTVVCNKHRYLVYHDSADILIDKVLTEALSRRYL